MQELMKNGGVLFLIGNKPRTGQIRFCAKNRRPTRIHFSKEIVPHV